MRVAMALPMAMMLLGCSGASQRPVPTRSAVARVEPRPFERCSDATLPLARAEEPRPVPVSDADRVIASLRPELRSCYQKQGLNRDPRMQGCVIMDARVSVAGEVMSTDILVSHGLSADVGTCLVSVLRSATFAPPDGGAAHLHVPVTFVVGR